MRVIILIAGLLASPAFCASLTTVEKNISDYVGKHKQDQITLLKKITNINSGTMNTTGVYKTGEIVREQLNQLGFKTYWDDEPKKMHRAGSLIAERNGRQGKHVLLIGHLDTVFTKKMKFKKYTQRKYSAKGQGVIDDKGGIVVMLYALKAMQAEGVLDNTSIIIVLTGDEESSGKPASISRRPLINAAKTSDIALGFEPAITLNTVTIARRGFTSWKLISHGNASHSATIFQKGVGAGAIFNLATCLDEIRKQMKGEKGLTFNPGLILGGSKIELNTQTSSGVATGKTNIVSSIAIARGDLRYIDQAQKNRAKDKMRAIAKKHLPSTNSAIKFVDGIPPMSPTGANRKLLQRYSQVSQDLHGGKVFAFDPNVRGAADISYVAGIVPASLSGLGPIGLGPHTVIESVELHSLVTQAQRAGVLIYRLTHC